MYQPAHFREERIDLLHQLMTEHPFATLIAMGKDGMIANHLPLLLDNAIGDNGQLRGHIARANPLWNEVDASADVLVVFQGPDAYISPNWYPSKPEHHKVVPTWNYAVVHAHCQLQVMDDEAFLRNFLNELTTRHESVQPAPWAMTDAPADYITSMVKSVVGIQLRIKRLEGKWKMSQNRSEADQRGVSHGLAAIAQQSGDSKATDMARIINDAMDD